MLDIDVTKQPFNIPDWRAILEAVHNALPQDEQSWIEWKSTLDLRAKSVQATEIAKTILAFANRDPDVAAQTLRGVTVMIIGLEPQRISGVTRIDNEELDKGISRYLGSDGPNWRPHWDTYGGHEILIIEVAPPRQGDRIHTFRKAFSDGGTTIHAGSIYVRKHARSVLADDADVQRLAARSISQPALPHLDLRFEIRNSQPLSKYQFPANARARTVASERVRLMGPLLVERDRAAGRTPPHSALMSISKWVGTGVITTPERRSEAEYEQQVDKYLARIDERWPEIERVMAAQAVGRPQFVVVNHSQRNYRQVQVKVHVAGEADAHRVIGDPISLREALPKPPALWGPQPFDLYQPAARTSWYSNQGGAPSPSTVIERSGSFDLTFPPVDVRPGTTVILEDQCAILIPAARTEPVIARWSATCLNVDATASGYLPIPFDGPDVNPLPGSR